MGNAWMSGYRSSACPPSDLDRNLCLATNTSQYFYRDRLLNAAGDRRCPSDENVAHRFATWAAVSVGLKFGGVRAIDWQCRRGRSDDYSPLTNAILMIEISCRNTTRRLAGIHRLTGNLIPLFMAISMQDSRRLSVTIVSARVTSPSFAACSITITRHSRPAI